MLSVIIATLNDEENLVRTLSALVPAAAIGLVRDVIVCDGGSRDATGKIAEETGALFVEVVADRGTRLAVGVKKSSRGEWLMFLAPGSVLQPGWMEELQGFIERAERSGKGANLAAVFSLAIDDFGWQARFLEAWARIFGTLLLRPFTPQGLVLSRSLYEALGGFCEGNAHPERALISRIGRRRLVFLRSAALVPARLPSLK